MEAAQARPGFLWDKQVCTLYEREVFRPKKDLRRESKERRALKKQPALWADIFKEGARSPEDQIEVPLPQHQAQLVAASFQPLPPSTC